MPSFDQILPPEWREWEIQEEIGEGAYGVVYRAEKRKDSVCAVSAIKVVTIPKGKAVAEDLRQGLQNEQSYREYLKDLVDGFANEIRTMYELQGDSHIVSIQDHAIVEAEGGKRWKIFIRMEYLQSFRDYEVSHLFTQEDIIRLGVEMCQALARCEEHGIIHRDLKPANIFVTSTESFKLGDFGVARFWDRAATASAKGTWRYMAPEVARGEKYSSNADLYSLGLVLYELTNRNREPFVDTERQLVLHREHEEAIIRRLQGEALPDPLDAGPELAAVIRKATSYDPAIRYQHASEMQKDLEALREETEKKAVSRRTEESEQGRKPAKVLLPILLAAGAAAAALMLILPRFGGNVPEGENGTVLLQEEGETGEDSTGETEEMNLELAGGTEEMNLEVPDGTTEINPKITFGTETKADLSEADEESEEAKTEEGAQANPSAAEDGMTEKPGDAEGLQWEEWYYYDDYLLFNGATFLHSYAAGKQIKDGQEEGDVYLALWLDQYELRFELSFDPSFGTGSILTNSGHEERRLTVSFRDSEGTSGTAEAVNPARSSLYYFDSEGSSSVSPYSLFLSAFREEGTVELEIPYYDSILLFELKQEDSLFREWYEEEEKRGWFAEQMVGEPVQGLLWERKYYLTEDGQHYNGYTCLQTTVAGRRVEKGQTADYVTLVMELNGSELYFLNYWPGEENPWTNNGSETRRMNVNYRTSGGLSGMAVCSCLSGGVINVLEREGEGPDIYEILVSAWKEEEKVWLSIPYSNGSQLEFCLHQRDGEFAALYEEESTYGWYDGNMLNRSVS